MRNSVTTLAIASVIASVLTGGVAVASPSSDTYSRTVRVSDLNLSSERGADTALRRIRNAAEYVCGDGSNAHVLWTARSYRSCVREAQSRAIADLGHPMVTARSNGGKPVQIAGK